MEPDRIILITGGVETLTYFTMELGKTFEAEGYRVFYYDLRQKGAQFGRLKKFIKPGRTVFVTFNFIGISEEEFIYHRQYGYIWEQYGIPIYNMVVDHPLYYHNHLKHPLKGCHYIGIDRNHVRYVEKYYKEVKVCGFLPLAGTELLREEKEEAGVGAEERDIPVLMTGNYKEPDFFKPYIERLDEEYTCFYNSIIREMLASPQRSIEEVAKEFCVREMGEITDKDFAHVLSSMNFIDLYVRNRQRGDVVRTLTDHGIRVRAVGDGWEKLGGRCPENLEIFPQTDSEECLKLAGRAQISLNVMPGFKDGAHDRIFNAILNGAAAVSDDSVYLREILPEGCGICYYDMKHLESLPELIKELLENSGRRQQIQRAGYEAVREKHTWRQRAGQIINWIRAV